MGELGKSRSYADIDDEICVKELRGRKRRTRDGERTERKKEKKKGKTGGTSMVRT